MTLFPTFSPNAMQPIVGQLMLDSAFANTTSGSGALGEANVIRTKTSLAAGGRHAKYVRVSNRSGGTLIAGAPVRFSAAGFGTLISGYADPTHPYFAGWVPHEYGSAGVPNNGVFQLLVEGAGARYEDLVNVDLPPFMDMVRNVFSSCGPIDHFTDYVAGQNWTKTADGAGAVAIQDLAGGVILLTTDTSDNNEVILGTPGATFLFAQNQPIVFGARLKVQEVATNTANVYMGLSSVAASSLFGDDGAGPGSNFSGALFYKVDGGTVWNTIVSLGTTQTKDTTHGPTRSTSAYTDMFCVLYPTSATTMAYQFYQDGVLITSGTFTYTSAAQMRFYVGVHTGTGSAETLLVDRAFCRQLVLS